jgi:hypothetical protein
MIEAIILLCPGVVKGDHCMKIVSTNHPTILVDEIGYDHNKLPVGVIHTSVDLRTGQLQNMLFPDADTWGICKRMTQVRGIGMKTARDMVIKAGVAAVLSSVRKGDSESFLGLKGMGSKRGKDIAKALFPEAKTLEKKEANPEAVAGLIGLGYKKQDAQKSVLQAMENLPDDCDVQELVKEALKR